MSPSGGLPLPSGGEGATPSPDPASEVSPQDPESTFSPSTPHPDEPLSATIGPSEEEEGDADEEGEDDDEEEEESEDGEGTSAKGGEGEKKDGGTAPAGPKPPGDARKGIVRFILFFMGFLGLFMLIDPSCWSNPPSATCSRIEVANALGYLLAPALGFNGDHILATMFLAAALEMAASALAYHITTDWIETARVAKHGQAIRPLWMKALRSGKKDRVAALKPHMDSLNSRQSRVTINQFKGMVITWVLLIAIYTWVGLYITAQCPAASVSQPSTAIIGGSTVSIDASVSSGHGPYNLTWWAQQESSGQPFGPVVGPVNTPNLFWPFTTPSTPGTYTVTLQVIDARDNVVVRTTSVTVVANTSSSSVGPSSSLSTSSAPALSSEPLTPPGVTPNGCAGSSVDFFGAQTNLLTTLGPFPLWFLAFSLYTFPCNLIFRRYLKHTALSNHLEKLPPPGEGGVASPSTGQALT